jgi:hypothetical protein
LWLLPSLSDVEGMGASLKYKPTIVAGGRAQFQ